MRFWRIYHRQHSDPLSGEGARIYGGRWNPPGLRALYIADTPSLAALEVLVHAPKLARAQGFVAAEYAFDARQLPLFSPDNLPKHWDAEPPGQTTQQFGYEQYASHNRVGFRVPSVVVPLQHNGVLLPDHPDFAGLRLLRKDIPFPFDSRLLP